MTRLTELFLPGELRSLVQNDLVLQRLDSSLHIALEARELVLRIIYRSAQGGKRSIRSHFAIIHTQHGRQVSEARRETSSFRTSPRNIHCAIDDAVSASTLPKILTRTL